MKRFIAIVPLLLVLTGLVPAQIFLPHRHMTASAPSGSNPFTPRSISGIRYYWVSEDISTNSTVTNWVDRIQSNAVSQIGTLITNSPAGVWFPGNTGYLSIGTVFSFYVGATVSTGSVWIVHAPQTPTTTFFGFAALLVGVTQGHGLYTKNTTVWGLEPNDLALMPFTSGNKVDLGWTLSYSNVAGTYTNKFYTNNVAALTNIDFVSDSCGYIGGTTNFGGSVHLNLYKGYIMEIAFYSNVLTSTDLSNLHNYATNKYNFTP